MAKQGSYRSEFKNHSLRPALSPEDAAKFRAGDRSVKSRSPIRAIAYRAGAAPVDERERTPHNYRNRTRRVVERSALFMPDGAPDWAHDRERR